MCSTVKFCSNGHREMHKNGQGCFVMNFLWVLSGHIRYVWNILSLGQRFYYPSQWPGFHCSNWWKTFVQYSKGWIAARNSKPHPWGEIGAVTPVQRAPDSLEESFLNSRIRMLFLAGRGKATGWAGKVAGRWGRGHRTTHHKSQTTQEGVYPKMPCLETFNYRSKDRSVLNSGRAKDMTWPNLRCHG